MATPHIEPAGPPKWAPGVGWERAKAELGDMVPDLTDDDERHLDQLLAAAGVTPVESRPVSPPARPRRSGWSRRWSRRTA